MVRECAEEACAGLGLAIGGARRRECSCKPLDQWATRECRGSAVVPVVGNKEGQMQEHTSVVGKAGGSGGVARGRRVEGHPRGRDEVKRLLEAGAHGLGQLAWFSGLQELV
jgi:hypothetical protein